LKQIRYKVMSLYLYFLVRKTAMWEYRINMIAVGLIHSTLITLNSSAEFISNKDV